jgi:hypothetical protein
MRLFSPARARQILLDGPREIVRVFPRSLTSSTGAETLARRVRIACGALERGVPGAGSPGFGREKKCRSFQLGIKRRRRLGRQAGLETDSHPHAIVAEPMRATRTLIQIFLPRMALRRKRAPTPPATARDVQPRDVRSRVSLACESPELRGRTVAVLSVETITPLPRRASSEAMTAAAHLSVLAESVLSGGPVLAGKTPRAGEEVRS